MAKEVTDLVTALVHSLDACPKDRMVAVWHMVYASFKGIIQAHGDNSYSHHTGSCAAHTSSAPRGDSHDRLFPLADILRPEKMIDTLCMQFDIA